MKKCSVCNLEKDYNQFHKAACRKDGYYPVCKECRKNIHERDKEKNNQRSKQWHEQNKERAKNNMKKWAEANKEKKKQMDNSYYKNNKEIISQKQSLHYKNNRSRKIERQKEYYAEHKSDFFARNSKRRGQLKYATPSWCDMDAIKRIYMDCPSGYHVDHIIPLQGDNVCGLHVSWNLQYLTAEENIAKGNKIV